MASSAAYLAPATLGFGSQDEVTRFRLQVSRGARRLLASGARRRA